MLIDDQLLPGVEDLHEGEVGLVLLPHRYIHLLEELVKKIFLGDILVGL